MSYNMTDKYFNANDATVTVYTMQEIGNHNTETFDISKNLVVTHHDPNFTITCSISSNTLTITFAKGDGYFGYGEWGSTGIVGYELLKSDFTYTTSYGLKKFSYDSSHYSGDAVFTINNLSSYGNTLYIRLLCNLCDSAKDPYTIETLKDKNGAHNVYKINLHTHIDYADKPEIKHVGSNYITINGFKSTNAVDYSVGYSKNYNGPYTWPTKSNGKYPDPGEYKIEGLEPNTLYYIKTSSKCSCGEWYESYVNTATTCVAKPGDISVRSTSYKSMVINVDGWDQISINGGTWKNINGASTYTVTGTPGTTYKIKCKKTCANHTANHDGIYESNEISCTLWKISLSNTARTTKSLSFKADHTSGTAGTNPNTGSKIVYKLYDDAGKYVTELEGNDNATVTFDNLTHNKQYTCKANTVGDWVDHTVEVSASTKLLSLIHSSTEEHQHSIITKWQAKIDGAVQNTGVTGNALSFSAVSKAVKSTKTDADGDNYQKSTVTVGNNGTNSNSIDGDYIKNISSNLTWYHCGYEITGTISDGYNNVSVTLDGDDEVHTTFPYSWIYYKGDWKRAKPYIYTKDPNNTTITKWIPAVAHIYNKGAWKESNGE